MIDVVCSVAGDKTTKLFVPTRRWVKRFEVSRHKEAVSIKHALLAEHSVTNSNDSTSKRNELYAQVSNFSKQVLMSEWNVNKCKKTKQRAV